MQLHHIEGRPQWETVPAGKRNKWQIAAARSGGLLTLPNLLTIGGLLIALYGVTAVLRADYWVGFAAILVGRLLDIADGYSAELTGTKSPLGEALDAGSDKVVTVCMIAAVFAQQLAPWYLLTLLLLPHVVIAGISLWRMTHGSRLHPSRVGKLSMAGAWCGLLAVVLVKALPSGLHSAVSWIAHIVMALSAALGFWALIGYLRPNQD